MRPHIPTDWPRYFEQHLNAGDLPAVMDLYEPGATFVAESGDTIVGRDGIRRAVAGLIAAKAKLHGRVVRHVVVGDVGVLYTDWRGTSVDPLSGATVDQPTSAIEVVRRQSDGTWKLIMGDPNGRGRAAAGPKPPDIAG